MASYDGLLARLAEVAPQPGWSVHQMRAAHEAAAAKAPLPPVTFEATLVEPASGGSLQAEWVIPPGLTTSPARPRVGLYLHGGGYVEGSPASGRPLACNLALAIGAPLLSLDYRLAPEHPFPAAVHDARDAMGWLTSRGHDPGSVLLFGDSAGGGLVIASLLALRDGHGPLPAGGVCISPWMDLSLPAGSIDLPDRNDPMVSRWMLTEMADHYLAGADPRAPLASPVYADLRGLPPVLVHVGEAERLLDDSTRWTERARAAGVDATLQVWPEMFHVWHAFAPRLPQAAAALADLAAWADRIF
ncbi:MAG: alpha/beta hydrolase [Streptosporangiaceae bacterium]